MSFFSSARLVDFTSGFKFFLSGRVVLRASFEGAVFDKDGASGRAIFVIADQVATMFELGEHRPSY